MEETGTTITVSKIRQVIGEFIQIRLQAKLDKLKEEVKASAEQEQWLDNSIAVMQSSLRELADDESNAQFAYDVEMLSMGGKVQTGSGFAGAMAVGALPLDKRCTREVSCSRTEAR